MALLIIVLVLIVGAAAFMAMRRSAGIRPGQNGAVADARADAQSWVERLGGQITMLVPGDSMPAQQALADASERHTAAVSQITQATSVAQFGFAKRTAVEGLYYIRGARTALGIDPGPDLPSFAEQQPMGTGDQVRVDNQTWTKSSQPDRNNPYYFAGGSVNGNYAPAGWYSQPWWKTVAVAGIAGLGGMVLMDGLMGGFNDYGNGYGDDMGGDYSAGGFDDNDLGNNDLGDNDFGGGDMGGFF
ncbi:DUF1542 domain-containing protein [Williamsia sp.]|uniref:DUF1542 domain-containing protein n=1 Tax=Williamsia sp. TaxID=1872085 RepID=UPI001A273AF1|nr:DUF1542 domain-containing protein [Williamsia sp.]MBJ7288074.1 DUF1542 domain-containing protein [Williamsia sp.]